VPPLLEAEAVWASYDSLRAVQGMSLQLPEGALAAVLGPNGAGKSTLLRVLGGLHRAERGRVWLRGEDVTGLPAHQVARRGMVLVPEGRAIFPSLSVADNLRLAGARDDAFDRVVQAFPVLGQRMSQTARTLSGGEQQMLALARCTATGASVLLLDEPSLALAPRLVDEVFRSIGRLRAQGKTILLVEQYVTRALEMADLVYVMEKGRGVFAGEPGELAHHPVLERTYLGHAAPQPVAGGAR
jgi:branched-chain amino acid transport system ATP-binding protein